jgi:hypothetical protein
VQPGAEEDQYEIQCREAGAGQSAGGARWRIGLVVHPSDLTCKETQPGARLERGRLSYGIGIDTGSPPSASDTYRTAGSAPAGSANLAVMTPASPG